MTLATSRPGGGAQRTRAAILASARQAFSTKGYSATGVREITAAARVNLALVSRYFGSKEKLFDETLREMLDISVLTGVARENFGEHVVQILTGEKGADRNPLPMMVLASTDPVSRGICADLLRRLVAAPLAAWLGEPEASARVARFVMLASGLTIHREIYPLDGLAPRLDPGIRAWLVSSFQAIADPCDDAPCFDPVQG
jgi:AcrR family transcriptional regulator